jgi:Ran GTPase-activating protein (RanGAP) involved in mRNA processing and transport
MQTNKTIRTLRLANVGATNTSIDKLSESLKANVGLALEELDVSGNPLEDKSIIALSSALERFTGLGVLNISNCQLKTKGMSALMQALQKNTQVCSTLHTLNIAGNSLDNQECSRNLGLFIGKAVALKTLNLTGTSPQCLYMCSTFEKNHSITTVYLSDFKVNAKAVDDLVLFLKQMPLLMDLNLRYVPFQSKFAMANSIMTNNQIDVATLPSLSISSSKSFIATLH